MSERGSHTPLRWLADEGSMEVFVEQRRGRGSMSESGGNAAPLEVFGFGDQTEPSSSVRFVDNVTRGRRRRRVSKLEGLKYLEA